MNRVENAITQLVQAVSRLSEQCPEEVDEIRARQSTGLVEAVERASRTIAEYDANFPIVSMDFVVLINSLSKAFFMVKCGAALTAMCQIAQLVAQSKLTGFPSQAVAVLVNELSKVVRTADFDCRPVYRAMDQIYVNILQRNLANFETQMLLNVVDGLSQASTEASCQNVHNAMDHIAMYLLQRDWANFEPQKLVNLLNLFSQASTEASCQNIHKAMGHFIMELLRRDLTNAELELFTDPAIDHIVMWALQRDWESFEPRELANLLNIFSQARTKVSCQKVLKAMDQIVKYILQRDLVNFATRELANLLNSFSQARIIASCQSVHTAMELITVELLRRNLATAELEQLTDPAMESIARYVLQCDFANFGLQQLASLPNLFSQATTRGGCQDMREVLDQIIVRIFQCDLIEPDYESHQLVNLVLGLCKANGVTASRRLTGMDVCANPGVARSYFERFDPPELVRLITDLLVAYFAQRDLETLDLKLLANLVSSANRALKTVYLADWTKIMDFVVEHLSQCELERFGSPELAQLTMNLIAVYISQRGNLLNFNSQQLATIVGGLSRVVEIPDFDCQQVLVALDYLAVELSWRNLEKVEPQRLADVVKVFLKVNNKLGRGEGAENLGSGHSAKLAKEQIAAYILLRGSAQYILQRELEMFNLKQHYDPKEFYYEDFYLDRLVDLVYLLSQAITGPGCTSLHALVNSVSVAISKPVLAKLDPEQLAYLVKGLGRVAGMPGCENGLAAMIRIAKLLLKSNLKKFGPESIEFTPEQLADLVNGLGQVVGMPGCACVSSAMDRLAALILQLNLAEFYRCELASLVNGFSQVVGMSGCAQVSKAMVYLARTILQRGLTGLGVQELVNLVEGFSKAVVTGRSKQALTAVNYLVAHILELDLTGIDDPDLVRLTHALSKASCQGGLAAANRIDHYVKRKKLRFSTELDDCSRQPNAIKASEPSQCVEAAADYSQPMDVAQTDYSHPIGTILSDYSQPIDAVQNDYSQPTDATSNGFGQPIDAISTVVKEIDGQLIFMSLENAIGRGNFVIKRGRNLAAYVPAICQIAQLVAQGKREEYSCQAIVALVNGLNEVVKLSASNCQQQLHKALDQVARWVSQRNLANFKLQELADLFNIFSQVPPRSGCQNVPVVMDLIAVHFSQRVFTNCDSKQLVQLVARFCEVIEVENTTFLASPQGGIAASGRLQFRFEHYEPQLLVRLIMDRIAVYIQQRNLATFKPQQLSDLVYGFNGAVKKFGFGHEVRTMDAIVVQLSQSELEGFESPQLAKLSRNRIAEYILQRNLEDFELPELKNVVNGLSKVVEISYSGCDQVLDALDRIAVELLQRNWVDRNSQAPANIVSKFHNVLNPLDYAEETALAKERIAAYILHRDSAKDILRCTLEKFILQKIELQRLTHLISELSQAASRFACQNIAIIVDWASTFLSKSVLKNCEPQQLADVVNGLSQVVGRYGCKEGDAALARIVKTIMAISKGDLAKFKSHQLVGLAVGLSGEAGRSRCKDRVAVTARLAKIIVAIPQCDLAEFTPHQLADLVSGLGQAVGRTRCNKEVSKAMAHLAGYILQRKLTAFSIDELANLVSGFRAAMAAIKGDDYNQGYKAINYISRYVSQCNWATVGGSELSRLYNELARVVDITGCQDVRAAINSFTVANPKESRFSVKLDDLVVGNLAQNWAASAKEDINGNPEPLAMRLLHPTRQPSTGSSPVVGRV